MQFFGVFFRALNVNQVFLNRFWSLLWLAGSSASFWRSAGCLTAPRLSTTNCITPERIPEITSSKTPSGFSSLTQVFIKCILIILSISKAHYQIVANLKEYFTYRTVWPDSIQHQCLCGVLHCHHCFHSGLHRRLLRMRHHVPCTASSCTRGESWDSYRRTVYHAVWSRWLWAWYYDLRRKHRRYWSD